MEKIFIYYDRGGIIVEESPTQACYTLEEMHIYCMNRWHVTKY